MQHRNRVIGGARNQKVEARSGQASQRDRCRTVSHTEACSRRELTGSIADQHGGRAGRLAGSIRAAAVGCDDVQILVSVNISQSDRIWRIADRVAHQALEGSVSRAEQDFNTARLSALCASAVLHDGEVGISVVIHIAYRERDGCAAQGIVRLLLEGAVAVAQQHRNRLIQSIGCDNVQFFVAVYIGQRHRYWAIAHSVRGREMIISFGVRKKYSYVARRGAGGVGTAVIGNHQGRDIAPVQVARSNRNWLHACQIGTSSLESAVPIAGRYAYSLRRMVDNCQIDMTVPIEIARDGGNGRATGHKVNRSLERPVAVSIENAEGVAAIVDDHQIR